MLRKRFKEFMESPPGRGVGVILGIIGFLWFLDRLMADPTAGGHIAALAKFLEVEIFSSLGITLKSLFIMIVYCFGAIFWLWSMPESKFLAEGKNLCQIGRNKKEDYANLENESLPDRNKRTQYKLCAPLILMVGVTFEHNSLLGIGFLVSLFVSLIVAVIFNQKTRR